MKIFVDGIEITGSTGLGTQVQGPDAHDAVAAGNPIPTGGFATQDFSAETDVAAGDRVRHLATLKGAQIIAGGVELGAVAFADYVSTIAENDNERPLAVGLYAVAPDGSADRVRTLGDTAGAGLGVLAAAPWIPGASDVKTKVVAIGATSASINTAIDPTSGKKIRVISLGLAANDATAPDLVGVYFGTGAAYLTNPASAIHQFKMETFGDRFVSWPDGGGPVGAADDNLSWITQSETETTMNLTIVYREE